jgi:DNA replication and repair protein RecF
VHLERLWLTDFRSYPSAELAPAPDGLTVLAGENGSGKTNLLEAIGYLATLRSFRGAPGEALVRDGAPAAVVRAAGRRNERSLLVEAEVLRSGRDRVQVNRQPLRRSRDLLGAFQVSVFTPEDLEVVKGGPGGRRRYLDELLVSLHPRHDQAQTDLERVLRQRNALLRSAAGRPRPSPEVLATLEVWDQRLAVVGETLVAARRALVDALEPRVADAYRQVATGVAASGRDSVAMRYEASWSGSLADALLAARGEDLRRGVTTTGPHRDELSLSVGGRPARTHASQGEQRCVALALRLAGHHLVTNRIGSAPLLLLDDVFSELDPLRASTLLAALPPGQALLTTAGALPPGCHPELTVQVRPGVLVA